MADDSSPTRSALRSLQLSQLQVLLRTLVPANPFYTAKLGAAGVGPELNNLDDFSHFPFTTKSELVEDQRAHPPFGTNLTNPLDQYTRYHQTSGTTGLPLRWLDDPQSWSAMVDCWVEIFRAAQVTATDRIVFAFSFGPFIGFWLAFDAGSRIGALCLPAGGLSSVARLRMILDTRATVLCGTPTYALRLAEVALEEKIDLGQCCVRRIIVAGEPGGSVPATRARLERLWPGARVFDHHGMTETGPVTYECPARPGFLHVMEAAFLAEIIDPASGRSVDAGVEGELVLTTLHRTGSPLLRYRTGDLVKVEPREQPATDNGQPATGSGAPCACGREEMTLAGGILGRIDDMVIIRGVNIYPTAVEHVLRGCGGIAEYQVQVNRSGPLLELAVLIEPDNTCGDVSDLLGRVSKSFQHHFALRASVQAVPAGSLPRFEMKAKRWLVSGA